MLVLLAQQLELGFETARDVLQLVQVVVPGLATSWAHKRDSANRLCLQ